MAKKKLKQINPRNKWIFIIGAFIVLFVIFFTTLPKSILAPTQIATPPNNWKAYENKEFGFSFKYPQNWQVKKYCMPSSNTANPCTKYVLVQSYPYGEPGQTLPLDANGLMVRFFPYNNPEKLSTKDFIESPKGLNHDGDPLMKWPIENEKIGPNIFIKEITNKDDAAHTPSYYIQDSSNTVYVIDGSITAKNYEYEKIPPTEYKAYINTFNQILSTFKFTDSGGEFCGGIMGKNCPNGYTCKLDGNYPDAGGKCVKQ